MQGSHGRRISVHKSVEMSKERVCDSPRDDMAETSFSLSSTQCCNSPNSLSVLSLRMGIV